MRRDVYYGRKSLSLQFYDVLTDLDKSVRGDIAFYARDLVPSATVLDIGCGTGRVALGLAQRGVRVVGIDLAEGMIAQARAKQRQLPPAIGGRVQFLVSDVLNLDLPVRFQRAVIPFYTLNFLPNRARRGEALKVVARHLASGGTLMVHTIPVERLQMRKQQRALSADADIVVDFDTGRRLELSWGERNVDAERQSTRQRVLYRHFEADGSVQDESAEELVFGWISEKEIEVAAAKAGLVVTEVRTSFIEGEPGSEKIYVLKKN